MPYTREWIRIPTVNLIYWLVTIIASVGIIKTYKDEKKLHYMGWVLTILSFRNIAPCYNLDGIAFFSRFETYISTLLVFQTVFNAFIIFACAQRFSRHTAVLLLILALVGYNLDFLS